VPQEPTKGENDDNAGALSATGEVEVFFATEGFFFYINLGIQLLTGIITSTAFPIDYKKSTSN
jgi:hypothetical protein